MNSFFKLPSNVRHSRDSRWFAGKFRIVSLNKWCNHVNKVGPGFCELWKELLIQIIHTLVGNFWAMSVLLLRAQNTSAKCLCLSFARGRLSNCIYVIYSWLHFLEYSFRATLYSWQSLSYCRTKTWLQNTRDLNLRTFNPESTTSFARVSLKKTSTCREDMYL